PALPENTQKEDNRRPATGHRRPAMPESRHGFSRWAVDFRLVESKKRNSSAELQLARRLLGGGGMKRAHVVLLGLAACNGSGVRRGGGKSTDETALSTYQSCGDLEADLKAMLVEEVDATFDQIRNNKCFPFPVEAGGDGAPTAAPGARQEGVDYSGTNNQE